MKHININEMIPGRYKTRIAYCMAYAEDTKTGRSKPSHNRRARKSPRYSATLRKKEREKRAKETIFLFQRDALIEKANTLGIYLDGNKAHISGRMLGRAQVWSITADDIKVIQLHWNYAAQVINSSRKFYSTMEK